MHVTQDEYEYDIDLQDDGTMDTVVDVTDCTTGKTRTFRYSDSSDYRDNVTGVLDFDLFVDDVVLPDADAEDWDYNDDL